MWYPIAKTTAEEAAWEFAKNNGINLVTLCPTFIIGYMIPPEVSSTPNDVLQLFKGIVNLPLALQYPGSWHGISLVEGDFLIVNSWRGLVWQTACVVYFITGDIDSLHGDVSLLENLLKLCVVYNLTEVCD